MRSVPRKYFYPRFALFRVRSPLLTESRLMSLPRPIRCFSSGGSPDTPILKFSVTYLSMNPGEFPHSEIPGSMLICSSPRLIAAYHVFHRLPVPRHSPCALVRLTIQTILLNIWYPLDSLFCQRRLLLPFLLKLQYFLKELTIIFVSQLLFSFQGTSLSVFFSGL